MTVQHKNNLTIQPPPQHFTLGLERRHTDPYVRCVMGMGRDISLGIRFVSGPVAWVRVDTQTILSIHHNVITQNPRISLTYNDHRSWYLHIREVEESDRGWYMCQVNTDPMRSRKGYLQVVVRENDEQSKKFQIAEILSLAYLT
uniref:Ig-like domain-containing protein n=1 Tax=Anopheles culicifacies TaxID=139723 RepID=A0A182MKM8_9DIPT